MHSHPHADRTGLDGSPTESARATRADMHVHSSASRKPVFAFLSPFGCPESYSEPEAVYDQARARDMDLVTLTDHDTIEGGLSLLERRFEGVFLGEEVTVYFPEDRCKLHVLVWGLTPAQHEAIGSLGLRHDVYAFAAWLAEDRLAHALAHPLYVQNGRLSPWHLERASLLFKGFETLNGAHSGSHREALLAWLDALTPARVQALIDRHGIEPAWSRVWLKAATAGSDDHALLNVGRTWTSVTAPEANGDPRRFLAEVMAGRAVVGGQAGHGALLAHQLMTIGFEHYARRWHEHAGPVGQAIGRRVVSFAGIDAPAPKAWALAGASIKRAVSTSKRRELPIVTALSEVVGPLLEASPEIRSLVMEGMTRLDPAFANHEDMASFTDELAERLTLHIASGAREAFRSLDRDAIVDSVLSYAAVVAMQAPHVFALFHQNKERRLLRQVRARANNGSQNPTEDAPMRVMLFTDTLGDVNGVCRFIQNMGEQADDASRDLRIMTSTRMPTPDAPYISNHRPIFAGPMPGYQGLEVALPPLLKMLREADRFQPDVIHISTPGPVGMIGMIAARMLRTPVVGVYHTDFPAYIEHLFRDEVYSGMTAAYMRVFYTGFRTVLTRSEDYIESLMDLGLARDRMLRLSPGVDLETFNPRHEDQSIWPTLGVSPTSVKVLFIGRVSVEKNLPLLAGIWPGVRRAAAKRGFETELIVVGDGPYRSKMAEALDGCGAHFLGVRRGGELSAIYASSDLFAFPSATDTLGQVVLESQASGLPVIVSDQGGPKEVVDDGISGIVLGAENRVAWTDALVRLITDAEARERMGRSAQTRAARYSMRACFEQFWKVHEEAHKHQHRAAAYSITAPRARSISAG